MRNDELSDAGFSAYSDGHPLDRIHYREYKLILRPAWFGSPRSFTEFSKLVRHAAEQLDVALFRQQHSENRMVFPLYNEEVHLLGRRDITTFDDLAGKRVAIGREGSGTYLTARLLFKLSEVTPSQMVPIDTGEALSELKAGRVDAMFYVAGYPVKLLKEDVTAADKLALIPITNKSVIEFYPSVDIPADVYAWQTAPVSTVAVKAVLVSFDFRRRDCENIGRFAQLISTKLSWLSANGHPKWKAVDLNYPLKGWEQYDCVRKHLGKAPQPTTAQARPTGNPVADAIKTILGD